MRTSSPVEVPSLRQWFHQNARLPILLSFLAFLGVEVLFIGVMTRHQLELQTGVAERLAELSRVALEQRSTALLQTGFEIAKRELGALQAFVCEQGLVFILPVPQLSSCEIKKKFGYRILQMPVVGNASSNPQSVFSFYIQVPIFPREKFLYLTLAVSIAICILGVFFLRRVRQRLEKDVFEPLFQNLSSHLSLPIREFEELRAKLLNLNRLSTQAAVASAVLNRNAQVAHDIRSPLTALLFAAKDFENLPAATREVTRSAVKRIAAILESLSDKQNPAFQLPAANLKKILEQMIQEKSFEYSGHSHLQLRLNIKTLSPHVSVALPEEELKRILSNLINNAVEAMGSLSGEIEIGAQEAERVVWLWILDEGNRIPDEIFKFLGEPGFSFGKKEGRGLGLSHAKSCLEKVGGGLHLERLEPQGLQVLVEVPKAPH